MFRYKGGRKVGKGTYWNISNGSRIDIADEGTLPGDANTTYTRFPPGIVLLAGPAIGLLYVIAMPFIALGTIAALIGKKLVTGLAGLLGNLVSFGWRPSEANLTGKKKGKKKTPK
ncbi:MAG: hypothetical protein M1497_07580 [Nitrospirae bacterium]|nr:hypothetical protein [Nitrospirota bacterium]